MVNNFGLVDEYIERIFGHPCHICHIGQIRERLHTDERDCPGICGREYVNGLLVLFYHFPEFDGESLPIHIFGPVGNFLCRIRLFDFCPSPTYLRIWTFYLIINDRIAGHMIMVWQTESQMDREPSHDHRCDWTIGFLSGPEWAFDCRSWDFKARS